MSITTQIIRIRENRNTLRNKLVSLGLAVSTDTLDILVQAVDDIVNNGSISATVQEGETYTIPAGFHDGSGTVSGVAGGGNYTLQSKAGVTPTKKSQQITPDQGYYGLSDVTILAIPDAYQDVTAVTITADKALAGTVFVTKTGQVVTGTMVNNGKVTQHLDVSTIQYVIAAGYHDGTGTVSIVLEEKTVTPTKAQQIITPATGKVLSKVTVNPIPAEYQLVTAVDAEAGDVLIGKTIVDAEGNEVEGTMPNNGAVTKTLDTSSTSQDIALGYHNGTGKVQIVLEEKSVTPTKSAQNITPTAGKVLSKVAVAKIPDAYQDVTGVTAGAEDVLIGNDIVSSTGAVVSGTMPNNGSVTDAIDGMTKMSVDIPAGYTTGGTISLTDDIEEALAAI